MDVLSLGEVMNDVLQMHPLLCRAVDEGYGFSWFIGGPIVFKRELEPPVSESIPRKVVRDALYTSSFL